VDNYKLKPAKKNFKPKSDMPYYSHKSILKDLKNERISLVCMNSYNIILRTKEKEEENNYNIDKNIKKNKSLKNNIKEYFSKDDDMSHSFCILF
jgi:hypothetical protein